MEKELGDLFKKSGRIPEMNVKMMELRELEIELKDEQEKVGEYAPAIERIREIDELGYRVARTGNETPTGFTEAGTYASAAPPSSKKTALDAD